MTMEAHSCFKYKMEATSALIFCAPDLHYPPLPIANHHRLPYHFSLNAVCMSIIAPAACCTSSNRYHVADAIAVCGV